MAISMIYFSRAVFSMLNNAIDWSSRVENIDVEKLRLFFSDEEKKEFSNYFESTRIDTNSGYFAVEFSDKDSNRYLIVSSNPERTVIPFSDHDFIYKEPSLFELGVLQKEKILCLANNISSDDLLNTISIYDDNEYIGNTFEDIYRFFQPFEVYQINGDLAVLDYADPYALYSYYLLKCHLYGNSNYSEYTLDAFEQLILEQIEIPYRNLAYALQSFQWPFRFLETYRLIEHAFPVTYISELKNIGISDSPIKISMLLENIVDWRPKEDKAIEKIFDEIQSVDSFDDIVNRMSGLIKDSTKLPKWYYEQVRNQIVHYRSIHKNVSFEDDEWDVLINFNLLLIRYLYTTYHDCVTAWNSVDDK